MVVSTEIRIKSGAFAWWAERRDQTEVGEQPQGPVDRIERNLRDPFANTSKDGSRIRVPAALRDVTEDLHPLMGDLDSRIPADLLEVHHPTCDFPAVGLQRRTSSSE